MAVVVKRTSGNYYKVHRILTPDGNVFHLPETANEAESTPAGEAPKNGSLATPKDSASMVSIPEAESVVNDVGMADVPMRDLGDQLAPMGNYNVRGEDIALEGAKKPTATGEYDDLPFFFGDSIPESKNVDIAPEVPKAAKGGTVPIAPEVKPVEAAGTDGDAAGDAIAPEVQDDADIIKTIKERLNAKINNSKEELNQIKLLRGWAKASYSEVYQFGNRGSCQILQRSCGHNKPKGFEAGGRVCGVELQDSWQ